MRRAVYRIGTLLIVIAVAAAFIQLQPSGKARVIRRGSRVHVLKDRVGIAARFGASCLVPLSGERLYFSQPVHVTTASGDEMDVGISFTYSPPTVLAPDWPRGDWCISLASRVTELATAAASDLTLDRAAVDPRSAN